MRRGNHGLDVLGIDEAENRVDPEQRADLGARVEGESNRCRVGHARSLDDDGIILLLAAAESLESLDEVSADCAAHTSVVHRDHILLCLGRNGRGENVMVW